MDIDALLAGFVGSLLGVVTGFTGAFFLDWQRFRRERRTHVLALVREMLSNNVRIQLLLKEARRSGSLEDRAWRDLRVPLAGELPMELYNRIASRYDEFSQVRRSYDELTNEELANADGQAAEQQQALATWAERMMEEHHLLRAHIGDRKDGLLAALARRQRRHADNREASQAAEHRQA